MKTGFHLPVSKSFLLYIGIVASIAVSGCQDTKSSKTLEEQTKKALSEDEYIERGKYLVEVIGCADCHSPKRMGERGPEIIPELALSGFQADSALPSFPAEVQKSGWMLMNSDLTAAIGPWGISYASNLTPDESGIKNWDLDRFKVAIRDGKYKGMKNGRMLLPPMPWQNYAQLSDEDLKAIFLHLQSIPPVQNAVPSAIPPSQLDSLQQNSN
ncbi:diheme cytochrome c-553 [Gillisia sp. M10.2A]|uniref:Diheme cytochrome c-553 n=1 Tax=Gillisia lutea TaxID=2909668 RepID=A0ABS9EDW7_9FLAO|nr:diheme cytochrome c-553 [Gillisia lutea]MCF4100079.1 diheme cytochrome c-553 [Gillisia lutea]